MKKFLFFVMISLATLNGSAQEISDSLMVKTQIAKAKWGDGQAYLQLADCYRDGRGVKQDFLGMMTMVTMAAEYGAISRMKDYLDSLPSESDYKMVVDTIDKYGRKETTEALAIAEKLIEKGELFEGLRNYDLIYEAKRRKFLAIEGRLDEAGNVRMEICVQQNYGDEDGFGVEPDNYMYGTIAPDGTFIKPFYVD